MFYIKDQIVDLQKFKVQTVEMHQLKEKKYSEIRIIRLEMFKKGATKV